MSGVLPISLLDGRARNGRVSLGERTPISVRLPPALIEKIDAFAHAGYRSRNAEIQRLLEEVLENQSLDEHGVIVVQDAARNK